jgi:hypothetical protein
MKVYILNGIVWSVEEVRRVLRAGVVIAETV